MFGRSCPESSEASGKDTGKERSAQGREDGSCKGEEQKGEEIKGKKPEEESEQGSKPEGKSNKESEEKKTDSRKTAWWVRLSDMLSSFFKAVKETFQNIQYTISKLCDKIKQIRDNIDYYIDVLTLDETQLILKMYMGRPEGCCGISGPGK